MSERSPLFVALAEVELHLPGARSLKEKRSDLRSLIERLRGRFPVLVVESDHQDLHQRAGIAITSLASEGDAARGIVERALEFVNHTFPGFVADEQVSVTQVR